MCYLFHFYSFTNTTLYLFCTAIIRTEAGNHFHHTGKDTDTRIIKVLSLITPGERGKNLLVIPELLTLQGPHHLYEGANPGVQPD